MLGITTSYLKLTWLKWRVGTSLVLKTSEPGDSRKFHQSVANWHIPFDLLLYLMVMTVTPAFSWLSSTPVHQAGHTLYWLRRFCTPPGIPLVCKVACPQSSRDPHSPWSSCPSCCWWGWHPWRTSCWSWSSHSWARLIFNVATLMKPSLGQIAKKDWLVVRTFY